MPLSNPKHEKFVQAIARGTTQSEAYVAAGYSKEGAEQSASRLAQRPDIQARLAELRKEITASLTDCSIREVETRVRALQDRWTRLNRIIEARGADPDHAKAPGGDTGLLVRTLKQIGRGEEAETVEEFRVDTGLLRELRETEKQAAQELGQWAEKVEHTGEITLITKRLNAARDRLRKEGSSEQKELV